MSERLDLDAIAEEHSICPACGSVIDYCQGHGTLGDPEGARILEAHDNDEHDDCHESADCRALTD